MDIFNIYVFTTN